MRFGRISPIPARHGVPEPGKRRCSQLHTFACSGYDKPNMFGSHLSIAGGMHNALLSAETYGMDTVQVFTKNWPITDWRRTCVSGS